MIKVQNGTATRTPVPAFIRKLKPESLADLSWTDPALGVQEAAWWPEVDQSPSLGTHEKYGAETLIVDAENKRVIVTREVVPWTSEEIESEKTQMRQNMVLTRGQFALAANAAGIISDAEAEAWAGGTSLPAVADKVVTKLADRIEALTTDKVRRTAPLVTDLQAELKLKDEQVDAMFTGGKG